MADIFISYSRKDAAHALGLAEQLRSNGLGVWSDQQAIETASTGSTQAEKAIQDCKAFCLLLSRSALESVNVVKETSLAFESKCSIVLVELYSVKLTDDFHSKLAGSPRVAFTDLDAILLALKRIGVVPQAASPVAKPEQKPAPQDSRKSLIVLPFEDLSPPGEDNAWFADGLAGEMIDALAHIKSLRILDRKTSLSLRGVAMRTVEIGKEFNTRYFIEGSVRKFGDQIKISASLLDIDSGDYLWQESYKGKFENIFDIQESVAAKVVDGLKLTLTKKEKTLIQDHGTENAEAYALYVKAKEYYNRQTKEGLELTIQLLTEAIKLDQEYANAYEFKARALANLHRDYDRDAALLDEGMKLVQEALRLKPDLWEAYNPLSMIYFLQGKQELAEEAAKEYILNAPDDPGGYFTLGFFYSNTRQETKAIDSYEQGVKLNPESLNYLFNLVFSCDVTNNLEKRTSWAEIAIPQYERHLKLHPDDERMLLNFAFLLHWAGKDEEARETAGKLANTIDGVTLFNTASLQCMLKDYKASIGTISKAIESGFRDRRYLYNFLHDEEGVAKLKGTQEYEAVREIVEKL